MDKKCIPAMQKINRLYDKIMEPLIDSPTIIKSSYYKNQQILRNGPHKNFIEKAIVYQPIQQYPLHIYHANNSLPNYQYYQYPNVESNTMIQPIQQQPLIYIPLINYDYNQNPLPMQNQYLQVQQEQNNPIKTIQPLPIEQIHPIQPIQ